MIPELKQIIVNNVLSWLPLLGGKMVDGCYIPPKRIVGVKHRTINSMIREDIYRIVDILAAKGLQRPKKTELNRLAKEIRTRLYHRRPIIGGGIISLYDDCKNNVPLRSDRIDIYYTNQPKYRGTHYIFDLRRLKPLKDEFIICAIDADPEDNIIAHFVLLWSGNTNVYFDPYGVRAGKLITEFLQDPDPEINKKMTQPLEDHISGKPNVRCGYYCLYVVDCLLVGKTLSQALDGLSPDKLIEHFKTD